MKYKAVIFDLDGLMVNTEVMGFERWKQKGKALGVDITLDFYRMFIGAARNVVDEKMKEYPFLEQLTKRLPNERVDFFKQYYREPGSANKPGLKELYDFLKANGLKIAVASSSNSDYVYCVLGHLGFEFESDVIVCGDEVKIAKPDPAVFLKAEDHLGLEAKDCLILEDSRNGILAAKAANTDVVFIEDLVEADEQMKNIYLKKCDTLADVIEILKQ